MSNQRATTRLFLARFILIPLVTVAPSTLALPWSQPALFQAEESVPTRRVNVPYWSVGSYSIFWFGQVNETSNYADVRMMYNDQDLEVVIHIIDRLLWRDPAPAPQTLTDWDAVTLYLNLDGNQGTVPDANAFRFDVQVKYWEPDELYQASYRGNGSTWVESPSLFSAVSGWRGDGFNDDIDDKGWLAELTIPFARLGLDGPPPAGTIWGLSVVVHDRDDAAGSTIPDRYWPETMEPSVPATWGQMGFGIPAYALPNTRLQGITTIRQGLDGASVVDGHVGGHTTCGDGLDHWTQWGEANYADYEQVNIQNQWDVADYPCFSKYFVTFPLDALPRKKTIISAKLTMHLFGNAGGGAWSEPPDSYIQALTIGEDWEETTLSWNSAPLAVENIAGTWVYPAPSREGDEYYPYEWDVTRAVSEALTHGAPLRLALYSADGPMHTGKYFWSSDVGDWNAAGRPTLTVRWGDPCSDPTVSCNFLYLPLIVK